MFYMSEPAYSKLKTLLIALGFLKTESEDIWEIRRYSHKLSLQFSKEEQEHHGGLS
jgi:hypothetical protein